MGEGVINLAFDGRLFSRSASGVKTFLPGPDGSRAVSRRIGITLVLIVMMVSIPFTGCLGSSNSSGWTHDDLVIPNYQEESRPHPVLPTPQSPISFLYSYRLMWTMSAVYESYGGVTNISLENTGTNTIFVYRFGVGWVNDTISSQRETSVYIRPGETGDLGMLFFRAPEGEQEEYEIHIWMCVSNQAETNWHDYGENEGALHSTELHPCALAHLNYTIQSNPSTYFDRVNDRVDYGAVEAVADQIMTDRSPNKSINQIVGAFEWVKDNIVYLEDEGGDYWQMALETLERGTGDCEDQAIFITSIFGALGLNGRVNVIDQHAFASVFVSNDLARMDEIQEVIESIYCTDLPICYLEDDMGYWLVTDTTGYFYTGGMPARALPVEGGTDEWTFESTSSLITVDAVGPSSGWDLWPF